MSREYCRYCGKPIKKFLLGWVHKTTSAGFPANFHRAVPE